MGRSNEVTWGECATECEALGGFFPCIEDGPQNDEAFAALVSSGVDDGAWINVHDTASEGDWVCGTQTQTYLPWDPFNDEPNGGTGENCVNMWGPDPGSGGGGGGGGYYFDYGFDYGNYYDYGGTFREPRTWNDSSCDFDGFPCLCKTPTPCDA